MANREDKRAGVLSPCSLGELSKLAIVGSIHTIEGETQRRFWIPGSQGAPIPQPVGGHLSAPVSQWALGQAGAICHQPVLQPQPPTGGGFNPSPFPFPGSKAPQNEGALSISSRIRTSFYCPWCQGPWFRVWRWETQRHAEEGNPAHRKDRGKGRCSSHRGFGRGPPVWEKMLVAIPKVMLLSKRGHCCMPLVECRA